LPGGTARASITSIPEGPGFQRIIQVARYLLTVGTRLNAAQTMKPSKGMGPYEKRGAPHTRLNISRAGDLIQNG